VSLSVTVTPEPAVDVIILRLAGLLSTQSAPAVRNALLKCLAETPAAVLVDVAGLLLENRSRLAVFPAAVRTHGQPGTALLLYGAAAELTVLMGGGVLGGIPCYATSGQAHAAVASAEIPRRMRLRLGPTPAAPREARAMIAQACQSWQLGHLEGPASLIISELVANAVQHAGTDLVVSVALRGDHLHLGVRDYNRWTTVMPRFDDDRVVPEIDRGRGLFLVDIYSTAWGTHLFDDGKTVWATLRARGR